MENVTAILRDLIALPGPSGYEEPVSDYVMEKLGPYSYAVERDGMGNVTASTGNDPAKPRFLMTAHMDEVGMVVTRIVDRFIQLRPVATINMSIGFGLPYKIITESGPIPAVSCSPSVHLEQSFTEVWLDAGPRADRVQPGDPVIFDTEPRWLDDEKSVLAGKAMDDRIGCTVLLEMARILEGKQLSVNLTLGFTVQEEITARGAEQLGRALQPDYAIAVDAGMADDPVRGVKDGQPALGTGPIIRTFEGLGPDRNRFVNFSDREMVKALKKASDSVGAKYTLDASFNVYTDAAGIRNASPHTRSVYVGVPRRYSHSPYEVAHIGAIEKTVEVLEAYFKSNWVS